MAVVPSDGQRDREPDDQRNHDDPNEDCRPTEGVRQQLGALGKREPRTEVSNAPLQYFVLTDARPNADSLGRGIDWSRLCFLHGASVAAGRRCFRATRLLALRDTTVPEARKSSASSSS